MIDPLESHSRTIAVKGKSFAPLDVSLYFTFKAEEDLTLRQAHFYGDASIISTDPTFVGAAEHRSSNDFELNSLLNSHFVDLSFPLPKGASLFWGTNQLAIVTPAEICLIFS